MIEKHRVLFLAIVLLWIMMPAAPAGSDTAGESVVLGYYPAWIADELPPGRLDLSAFTHIVHAFAWPLKDGSISGYENLVNPELNRTVHDAGRVVSISFGGGGRPAGFPVVTVDPRLRAEFISNIIAFCDEYGYDGADFDWEFPSSVEERDGYAALVTELRLETERRGIPFLISMAISGASWPNFSNDVADMADTVDWFLVMTYNYSGPWSPVAGHNAPLHARRDLGYSLSVARSIEYVLGERGLPAEKLLLGIPFYGRLFEGSELYGPASGGEPYRYSAILRLMDEGGWTRKWDDVSEVPYSTDTGNSEILVYDDPESVERKCLFALERGLAGIGVWALGYDLVDGEQPLAEAIGRVMRGTTAVAGGGGVTAPAPFALEQNRPNPFNAETTIGFRLAREERVSLAVFTVTGQKIAVLAEGVFRPGYYAVRWNPGKRPSGVYICRLSAGARVETKKMVLIR